MLELNQYLDATDAALSAVMSQANPDSTLWSLKTTLKSLPIPTALTMPCWETVSVGRSGVAVEKETMNLTQIHGFTPPKRDKGGKFEDHAFCFIHPHAETLGGLGSSPHTPSFFQGPPLGLSQIPEG